MALLSEVSRALQLRRAAVHEMATFEWPPDADAAYRTVAAKLAHALRDDKVEVNIVVHVSNTGLIQFLHLIGAGRRLAWRLHSPCTGLYIPMHRACVNVVAVWF